MANYFNKIAVGISGMPKLPIALAVLGLFVISLVMSWEDYSTNLVGYAMFPTNKVNAWLVVPFAAALPQVAQIAFMYAFAINTESRWKLLAAFAFHLMDVTTDVYFKAAGSTNIGVWFLAFLESEVLFTLGSEVALTLCLGLLPSVLPPAIREVSDALHDIFDAINSGQGSGVQKSVRGPAEAELVNMRRAIEEDNFRRTGRVG